eukprot:5834554-Lingulodinium_polyedra.AAC.1
MPLDMDVDAVKCKNEPTQKWTVWNPSEATKPDRGKSKCNVDQFFSICTAINRSLNHSITQSLNHSINQSTHSIYPMA